MSENSGRKYPGYFPALKGGMADNAEITAIFPISEPVARTAAADRMRRHRERRRRQLRCLTIELRETEIEALIGKGLLKVETRNDPRAVKAALYKLLDRTLGSTL